MIGRDPKSTIIEIQLKKSTARYFIKIDLTAKKQFHAASFGENKNTEDDL